MSAQEKISLYHFQRLQALDRAEVDVRLRNLLSFSLIRVLVKQSEGKENYEFVPDTVLTHIADWLKAALVNNDEWLSNTDHLGRPKKLTKFGTVAQILAEADKAMFKAAQKLSKTKLLAEDETIEATLEQGFYLVQLLTPNALDRESSIMQHCIGDGAYDNRLLNGGFKYYSLRDGQGKPHTTIEIHDNQVLQLQGKQNRVPLQKYVEPVKNYMRQKKLSFKGSPQTFGVVVDEDGIWHELDNLPPKLIVNGDLDLRWTTLNKLPEQMVVYGNLDISSCNILRLPDKLKVTGNICLADNVEYLGKELHVGGNMELSMRGLVSLPEILYVGGNLKIPYNSIKNLPPNLHVGGHLDARSNPIKRLPKGLTVMGDLMLNRTNVSHIDADVIVGGRLYIATENLQTVHPNAQIAGKVWLEQATNSRGRRGDSEVNVFNSEQLKELFPLNLRKTCWEIVRNVFR